MCKYGQASAPAAKRYVRWKRKENRFMRATFVRASFTAENKMGILEFPRLSAAFRTIEKHYSLASLPSMTNPQELQHSIRASQANSHTLPYLATSSELRFPAGNAFGSSIAEKHNEELATAGNLFEGLVRIPRNHRTRRCSRRADLSRSVRSTARASSSRG